MQQTVDFNTGTRQNLIINAGRLELPTVSPPAFTRNSTAYLRNGTLINTNLPRFEAGRFGQAVMTEEGTTNLVAEMMSQARSGLVSNNGAMSTLTLVSDFGRSSNFSALSEQVAVGDNMGFFAAGEANLQSVTAGLVYTASCWVFTNAVGRSATLAIIYHDAVNANLGSFSGATTPLVAGTWTRITATVTAPANAVRAQLAATASISQIGERFWYTDLQLEQRPYATSWQLGGTPRVGELLTVPTTGVVNPVEGSVEFVWQPINQPAGTMPSQHTSPQIVRMGTFNTNNSWVVWAWNSGLQLLVRGAGATGWTGQWVFIPGTAWYVLNRHYHIAVTWSNSNTFHVFVDGVQYGPYVSTHAFTGVAGNILAIGGSDQSGHTNALYDDLRISNRARTLAEHQTAFNSGQPLPIDANTTYMLRADGNLNHGQGGSYTSPEYDLSIVGTAITSNIAWQAPVDGVTRDVSARLDGQAWTPITNGGTLPFMPGQQLTNRRLQLNALLRRG